jgi:nucleotide-binding universal stress UspA family protein
MAFERILVGTDFSDAADAALDVARDLAHRLGSEIVLLHASEALGVVPGSDLAEDARERAQRQIDERLARLHAKDVRARGSVRGGLRVDVLLQAAADEHASLLVLGTKAHSRLAELFGSLIDSVIDRAPCPVVTVRPPGAG